MNTPWYADQSLRAYWNLSCVILGFERYHRRTRLRVQIVIEQHGITEQTYGYGIYIGVDL